jgi:uncharacterized protein with HEPN domain
MLDMAQRAQRMIDGLERADLDRDEKLQLALVRALQVIGEAAWRTSKEFQAAHPQVPWRQIAGFRQRAVHDYFAIDYDIVWQIATKELSPLIASLSLMLAAPPSPPKPPGAS